MASGDDKFSDSSTPWTRIKHWLDVPSIIGIALILLFAIWLVRHYGQSIS